jgi:hypothetical protein
LLFVTVLLVAHVRTALFLLPSRLSLRMVRRLSTVSDNAPREPRPAAETIAWAIATASRVVPGASCLTQAVAGKLLLRHYGFRANLCIGVARGDEGAFYAHAWIERDGRVLIGGKQSTVFTVLSPFPPMRAQEPTLRMR